MVFAIHWQESAMGVHVFPILNPRPPLSPSHPSGSSQCIGPEHPVSCIEPGLAIYFTYDNIHFSMLLSQIMVSSPSPEFPAISCKLSKHLKLPCVSWANVYVMEVTPEAKIQTHRCLMWEAVSDDTELRSRWKNRMSTASVNSPSGLSRDFILVTTKIQHSSVSSFYLVSFSTFFCLLLLLSCHLLYSLYITSSFIYLTYYISTANSHTISLLNRIYSPLINILQN